MNQLQPKYRKRLAGDLLDAVYKEVSDDVIENLANIETITELESK